MREGGACLRDTTVQVIYSLQMLESYMEPIRSGTLRSGTLSLVFALDAQVHIRIIGEKRH